LRNESGQAGGGQADDRPRHDPSHRVTASWWCGDVRATVHRETLFAP